jgi:hypothetical protein
MLMVLGCQARYGLARRGGRSPWQRASNTPYTGKNLEKILSFLQNLMIFSQNDNFVLKFVKI